MIDPSIFTKPKGIFKELCSNLSLDFYALVLFITD